MSDADGPLPFATVHPKGSTRGTDTDEAGRFRLTLAPGTYELVASYVGYVAARQTVTVPTSEALTFRLSPNAELSEVVITGTQRSTYVTDSPVKVDVITNKQLETYLPTAGTSVVESISLVNGVQEVTACGVCYTNSISINGLPGPYTAILMDGMPIYGNLASVYGLNGIPSMIIDRFEVIKGPSSTLYGSEAVAGVINIITKDPESQPLLSVDLMGTSHLESFGNVALAPRLGKHTGFVGLNYAYLNDFDDWNADGFGDGINMDRVSLFTKWNIQRKSHKKFTLAGKYYYEDRRNGVAAYLRDRAYRDLRGSRTIYGESIYTQRAELFGTYAFDRAEDLVLDFSGSHHDQDSYYGDVGYLARQTIGFANLRYRLPAGAHDLLFGATARYQDYDDNSVATRRTTGDGGLENAPDRQFIPGLFVQDEWQALPQWTVLAGLRLDHYAAHGLIPAPRLSAKYAPNEWATWRVNFGTGFRIVNLFTEDHAFVTGQREVVIAETLRPERSYHLSANWHRVYAGLGGVGSLDVDAFFTHFANKIIPDYATARRIVYANTRGHARTRGVGLSWSHTFDSGLGYHLGWNVQRVTETDDVGTVRAVEFAPRYSGVLTANYRFEAAQLTLAYTANLTGPMALPEVYDLDAEGLPLGAPRATTSRVFSTHNLQVTKVFNARFSAYLGLQNIFNYRQPGSPLVGFNDPNAAVGFSEFFDTAYAYAPNHGREVYVGVKWQLARRE